MKIEIDNKEYEILYNPHGSDVTKYEVNNLIEKTTFITHTVQMEQ